MTFKEMYLKAKAFVSRNAGKIAVAITGMIALVKPTIASATSYPWDTMFTDAGTAVTALGASAATLIGIVFGALVLLLVGFAVVRKIAHKG